METVRFPPGKFKLSENQSFQKAEFKFAWFTHEPKG